MAKYKFVKVPSKYETNDKTKVMLITETQCLDDLVSEFVMFLKGCGYILHDLEVITNAPEDE